MAENQSSSGLELFRKLVADAWDRPEYSGDDGFYDDETDEWIDGDSGGPSDCRPSDCANWIELRDDKPTIRFGEPCHGTLSHFGGMNGFIEFDNSEPSDFWRAMLDWMMDGDDFPWAAGRPLIYENRAWYWTEQQLRNSPINAIGAFLVLSRVNQERPNVVELWCRLVEAGCRRHSALLYANLCAGYQISDFELGHLNHTPFEVRWKFSHEQYDNYMRMTPVGARTTGNIIPQSDYFGPSLRPGTSPYYQEAPDGPLRVPLKPFIGKNAYNPEVLNINFEQLVNVVKTEDAKFQ